MKIDPVSSIPKGLNIARHKNLSEQNISPAISFIKGKDNTKEKYNDVKLSKEEQDKFVNENAEKILDKLNQIIKMVDKKLEFSIHEATNRLLYKIINKETKEIIKEFPPEEILDLIGKMMEMSGLFVDEKI
jgi:flagellar protein FlaG